MTKCRAVLGMTGTLECSWSLLLLVVFVSLAGMSNLRAFRYFGYRYVPPASAFGGCLVGIGFDRDDVSALRSASARKCRFELRNRLHVLRQRAKRGVMRRNINRCRDPQSLHAI